MMLYVNKNLGHGKYTVRDIGTGEEHIVTSLQLKYHVANIGMVGGVLTDKDGNVTINVANNSEIVLSDDMLYSNLPYFVGKDLIFRLGVSRKEIEEKNANCLEYNKNYRIGIYSMVDKDTATICIDSITKIVLKSSTPIFKGAKLRSINFANLDVSGVSNLHSMFEDCHAEVIDLHDADFPKGLDTTSMFKRYKGVLILSMLQRELIRQAKIDGLDKKQVKIKGL